MKKLLLPRKYLSYSQMTCWLTNKERFRREYFEGGRKLNTKYLTFGKGIAESIEKGTYKELLPELIVYDICEHKILTNVREVPILSFIDTFNAPEHIFREYKTGKHAWTQAKVQKHEQLPFYAVALKWSTGVTPGHCFLDWIETSENVVDDSDFWAQVEKKLAVTGKITSFRRDFDPREVERMEKLIIKTAYEISDAYRAFIAEI